MDNEDYDDPEVEARWYSGQREVVQAYLQTQGISHPEITAEPEWSVPPYVSLWVIESKVERGAIGWWVISGDLPTDYLSGGDATDARSALDAFSKRWLEVSAYMLRDEYHPTVKMGPPERRRELGALLETRAQILQDWVEDDAMWELA